MERLCIEGKVDLQCSDCISAPLLTDLSSFLFISVDLFVRIEFF